MRTSTIIATLVFGLAACSAAPAEAPVDSAGSSSSEAQVSSSQEAQGKDVVIDSPAMNALVKSPLHVSGKAKGTWFSEGQLPILLTDSNNNVIVASSGVADGEWMTTDYVDFTADVTFSTTATSGFLVIKKDNPSGLPENDAEIKVPVTF